MSGKMLGWAMEQKTGSPTTKLVLVKLADNASENGFCCTSLQKIVKHTELSLRAVRQHLAKLEALDLIRVERRDVAGAYVRSYWHLNAPGAQVVQDVHTKESTCAPHARRVNEPHDGRAPPAEGVVHDVHSHIKNNPQEETLKTTNSARASAAPVEEQPKPAKSVFDERIWPEFRKVPGFSDNMAKASASKAFENIAAPRPETGHLVAAIRAWARFLANENAKSSRRNNPHPMAHPATWLHQRRWEGFLDKAHEAEIDAGALAHIARELQEFYAPTIRALGAACAANWLEGCIFLRGPPPSIAVALERKRNWLATQLIYKLRRVFGEDMEIQRKQEVKAA